MKDVIFIAGKPASSDPLGHFGYVGVKWAVEIDSDLTKADAIEEIDREIVAMRRAMIDALDSPK